MKVKKMHCLIKWLINRVIVLALYTSKVGKNTAAKDDDDEDYTDIIHSSTIWNSVPCWANVLFFFSFTGTLYIIKQFSWGKKEAPNIITSQREWLSESERDFNLYLDALVHLTFMPIKKISEMKRHKDRKREGNMYKGELFAEREGERHRNEHHIALIYLP